MFFSRWLKSMVLGEESDVKPAAGPQGTASTSPAAPGATATLPAATQPITVQPTPRPAPHPRDEYPPVFSQRSLRQLSLFLGGAGFLYCSVFLTRRAIMRHRIASQLKFFQPNWTRGHTSANPPKRGDPLVAVEALNLATLNTVSFAIMMAGGISWAFNISSLEDLREITRRSLGGAAGMTDMEAEKEVAAWVAKTLGLELKADSAESDEPKKS
ncbi:uncharacterized protein CTHT_0012960 [Thermochaetoides thermophila DSM 1495]|uniref:Altered inheritance of mitochondria protein 11 n=1 Tax=Chaetomium thermophilum (strain DSM 1495 / CBS 144.50 / IMI 039719) TaxID=759272 RepID=G0S1B0_CHATD|nr:hypothetical protein CTHT_0012960 [Thermochaetoides thermophila DSM 1495]EGS22820.1 hypothetical protein CTHT_0012960 [Thermochaetoides thermophila DSM 1495]